MPVDRHIVSVHCFKFVRALALPVFCVVWLALTAYYTIEYGFVLRLQGISLATAILIAAIVYDHLMTRLIHLHHATHSDRLERGRSILQLVMITVGTYLATKFTSSTDERILTSSFLCLCLILELCLRSGRLQGYFDEIDRMVRSKSPAFPWFDIRLSRESTEIEPKVLIIRDLAGNEFLQALRRSQFASEPFVFCNSFWACILQLIGVGQDGSKAIDRDATVEHTVAEMERNTRFRNWLCQHRWHAMLGDEFEIVNNVFDIRLIPRNDLRDEEILDLVIELDLTRTDFSIVGQKAESIGPSASNLV